MGIHISIFIITFFMGATGIASNGPAPSSSPPLRLGANRNYVGTIA